MVDTPLTTGGFLLNGLRNGGIMLDFDYTHAMQWLGDVNYAYTYAYACDQIIKAGVVLLSSSFFGKIYDGADGAKRISESFDGAKAGSCKRSREIPGPSTFSLSQLSLLPFSNWSTD